MNNLHETAVFIIATGHLSNYIFEIGRFKRQAIHSCFAVLSVTFPELFTKPKDTFTYITLTHKYSGH